MTGFFTGALLMLAALLPAQDVTGFTQVSKQRSISSLVLVREFEAPSIDDYKLDGGDEVTIEVWSHPELSSRQVVGPDGKVTVAVHGPIKLAGLTREGAQTAISQALAHFYSDLVVTVRVDVYSSFHIFVLGRVGAAGALSFTKQPTLLDVLAKAGALPVGGAGAEKAGLVRCAVFRGRDKIIWVDLKSLLSRGNLGLNIRLAPDDLVYLPDADDQLVYVLGFVKNPGAFRLTPAMSFLDALSLAGGPTEDAATSHIALIRTSNGLQREVPLKDVLSGNSTFSLEEGDIVYAPSRRMEKLGYIVQKLSGLAGFAIVGSVVKP